MEVQTAQSIQAPPETVFALVAEIERWPQFLPHYRWVRVLARRGSQERLVEMAAWRGWIPVWWRSVQRLDPERHRIQFLHVAGVTRGMRVEWRIEPDGRGGSALTLWHAFRPGWRLVPDRVVEVVVGELFVNVIAGRTLRGIQHLAEGQAGAPVG